MPGNVRIGLIGTSWWADLMYLPSLTSHPHAEVKAICGRSRAPAEAMAAKYGIGTIHADYREMIAAGGLDAVVVAAPDDQHYPMTMAALDAGLHVLCEKPMALNPAHARQMLDKAEAAGVAHMVLFTWRWQPHFVYLKRLLDEGFIGRCLYARLAFVVGHGRPRQYEWRFDGNRATGIAGDLCSHLVDFARWYVGEIESVSASLPILVDRSGFPGPEAAPVNDTAFVALVFAGGAHGQLEATGVSAQGDRLARITMELHGADGVLEVQHLLQGAEGGAVIRGVREGEPQFRVLPVPDDLRPGPGGYDLVAPYARQSAGPRAFIDAIVAGTKPKPDFRDGLITQQVVAAMLESDRQGRRIRVSYE